MFSAIETNNLSEIKQLCLSPQYLQEENDQGQRAIHAAAEFGRNEIIQFLLNKGANIEDGSNIEWKPLHYACRHGQLETVKFLLERGADMEVRDSITGQKPSHAAVLGGHAHVLEFLLSKGVSLNEADHRSNTLLHLAAAANEKAEANVAELLLRKGAHVDAENNEGKKPIHVAASSGNQAIIEAFLRNGVSIECLDKAGMTPLFHAAEHDRLQVFLYLIDRGANLNAVTHGGRKVIHSAARGGRKDTSVLEYLVSRKVNIEDPDNAGFTPLHYSVGFSQNAVKFLIGQGVLDTVSADGQTELHRAAQNKSHYDVDFLLDRGLDIDATDDNGCTALHHAILTDTGKYSFISVSIDTTVVRRLIKRGANVHLKDKKGKTPLDYAQGFIGKKVRAMEATGMLMDVHFKS